MGKKRYTPGPWEVRWTTRPGVWKKAGGGWLKIAEVEAPDSIPALENDGREANARVIATAPKMVEALEAALPILEYIIKQGWDEAPPLGWPHDEQEAYRKVASALAEAEGEM